MRLQSDPFESDCSRFALSELFDPHPEERVARLEGCRPACGLTVRPANAKHRPETALTRLLTMRDSCPLRRLGGERGLHRQPLFDRQRRIARPFVPGAEIHPDIL